MQRSNITVIAFFIVMVCILGGLTYWYLSIPKDAKGSDASSALTPEENGVYTNLAGEEVSFGDHAGRVRVVTSWASWNPFSVSDLHTLNTVAGTYKEKGVVFLAINRKESKEQAQSFLASLPSMSNIEFAIDTQDTFYTSIGGYAMPETVMYDTQGNIKEHTRGTLTESELRALLDTVLQTEF
jgi:thiol-disulfide isomerase/thioredoxin